MAVGRLDRAQILRELIADAESEIPRTTQEAMEQRGAVLFLRRKYDEAAREVMTGD